jgi:hypothetical protein
MGQACYLLFKFGFVLTDFSHVVDGHPLTPIQDQPFQADTTFSDSSGPMFSLYSKIAVEEDDKTAERWKTNADGILIFVSLRASIHISLHLGSILIEWFILCRRCNIARCDDPRPQAKSSRYLCVSSIHLLSQKLLCLGQLTLVLELDP